MVDNKGTSLTFYSESDVFMLDPKYNSYTQSEEKLHRVEDSCLRGMLYAVAISIWYYKQKSIIMGFE